MLHVLPLKLITAIFLKILQSEAFVSDGCGVLGKFGSHWATLSLQTLCLTKALGIYIYCHVEILVVSGNTQIKEESISMFAKL